MTERSLIAYENWKTSQEKFDYFILGVIGAFCAYVSQNITFSKLGVNGSTFELISLLIVLLSGVIAFLRLQTGIELHLINHRKLHLSEIKGQLTKNYNGDSILNVKSGEVLQPEEIEQQIYSINKTLPELAKKADEKMSVSTLQYKLRNYLLIIGFLLMLFAKVYTAYE